MSHAKNKLNWCLEKAKKEVLERGNHRGLTRIKPNLEEAREHIKKAEHYLEASSYLKKGNFSDICASTIFYSIYHCLLAIAVKFGYESRNQECTFAVIYNLIEEKKINLNKNLVEKIASLDVEKSKERTSIELREQYQYGTSLSIDNNIYQRLIDLAYETIDKTKTIIEED